METAQCWRPVWYGVEAHLRLHLSHPLATLAPHGRKRDFGDARRLVDRWAAGDLEESCVPAAEQRGWRWLTRTRVKLQRKIGMIRSQVEGLPTPPGPRMGIVTYGAFASLFARLSPKLGATGAAWAVAHRLGRGIWVLLHRGIDCASARQCLRIHNTSGSNSADC